MSYTERVACMVIKEAEAQWACRCVGGAVQEMGSAGLAERGSGEAYQKVISTRAGSFACSTQYRS